MELRRTGDMGQSFLNRGLLEYIATKISGESMPSQSNKKLVFDRLEPMMISYTGNPEILLEALLKKESTVHEFVEEFADTKIAYIILDSIRDCRMEELEKGFKKMERKVKIQCAINKLKETIGNIFNKKKIKTIDSAHERDNKPKTAREIFIERCSTNIQSNKNKPTGIKPIQVTFDREETK